MTPTLSETENWPTGKKIAFRFFATYFLLYLLPLNPVLWFKIVPWVGRTWLKLPYEITVFPNGSGDTTFHYVQVACYLAIAAVVCLVWSLLDRRRPGYNQALYGLLLLLRYYLALMMILYGFGKLNHSQFPFPGPYQLTQLLGQFSPMGLAWTFLGYSTGYNWFMGIAEIGGGILMLFRRTTLLGGIILIGVIGNIVAVNFAFDIPFKLFSSHLLLMTVFILVPDAGRLMDLLIWNRPTTRRNLTPVFTSKRMAMARIVVKTLLIGGFLAPRLAGLFPLGKFEANSSKKPSLHGLYLVTQFHRNGDSLVADSFRWRQVIVGGSPQRAGLLIRMANDSLTRYQLETDTIHRRATLFFNLDTTRKFLLDYWQPNSGSLVLKGHLAKDSVFVRLQRQADDHYPLVKRGFHWINERPFNR